MTKRKTAARGPQSLRRRREGALRRLKLAMIKTRSRLDMLGEKKARAIELRQATPKLDRSLDAEQARLERQNRELSIIQFKLAGESDDNSST